MLIEVQRRVDGTTLTDWWECGEGSTTQVFEEYPTVDGCRMAMLAMAGGRLRGRNGRLSTRTATEATYSQVERVIRWDDEPDDAA